MTKSELEKLPIRFDPQSFADQHTELNGLVATKAMQRLLSNVVASEPMVKTKLRFTRGLLGYPLAMGEAHAKVAMRCERCLDNVEIYLDPLIEVLVKPIEDQLPIESESTEESADFHEYEGKLLTLSELIEEELLLAMPLVPRHEDISLCNQDMIAWLASNEVPEADAKREDNPFAILKR